jgi:uncharacterized membrane protein
MTWYTFFKWVHVTAAVVWVGGAAMVQAYALRVLATRDGRRQAEFAKDTEVVGMRVFVPSTAILFLASIGLMLNGDWSWGQNWIVFALIVLALSFAVGAGFLGPEAGRIGRLIETEGPGSPAVTGRIRRINTVSRCELVVLLAVIWNMVVKPTGQGGWFWGALLVTFAAVGAILANYVRTPTPVAAPAPD